MALASNELIEPDALLIISNYYSSSASLPTAQAQPSTCERERASTSEIDGNREWGVSLRFEAIWDTLDPNETKDCVIFCFQANLTH